MGKVVRHLLVTMLLGTALWAQPAATPPVGKHFRASTSTGSRAGGYLGVDIHDLTPDRVAALKLADAAGVEITMVDHDAPAGKAGLREHDVITSFNGQKTATVERLRRQIRSTPAGANVTLGLIRQGQALTVKVQLASRKEILAKFGVRPPDMHPPMAWDADMPQLSVVPYWAHHGLIVEDLTPQLGEFLGVRNGDGVLVRSVEKGTPADVAGLRAGDVIVKANGERVTCSSDWRRVLRQQRSGTVNVGIIRDKREQSISLKLPERQTGSLQLPVPDMSPVVEQMSAEMERLRPEIERALRTAQLQLMDSAAQAMRQAARQLDEARREQERARPQ